MPYPEQLFMKRALDLAQIAAGFTSPNPLVGAVLVANNEIIGEGLHWRAGEPHAEVNAFESVAPRNRDRIPDSTLYVTLEPCCHTGKTPPCSDRIIAEGVKRVVVAMEDPFPAVGGKGIAKLREAGIEVEVGMLAKEAEDLNKHFLTAVRQQRPYITLKWAESWDGYIDARRSSSTTQPIRFSNDLRLRYVHRLRHLHDAILVGSNTFLLDNPSLTNRFWFGRQPIRIILGARGDSLASWPLSARIFEDASSPVWWVAERPASVSLPSHVREVLLARGTDFLPTLLHRLFLEGIQSLLVEGGATVLQAFLDAGLYDAIEREVAPFSLDDGVSAPRLGNSFSIEKL